MRSISKSECVYTNAEDHSLGSERKKRETFTRVSKDVPDARKFQRLFLVERLPSTKITPVENIALE